MKAKQALSGICIIILMLTAWAGTVRAQLDSALLVTPKQEPVQRARPFIRDSAAFMEKYGADSRNEEARGYTGTDGNDWMRTERNDAYYEEQAKQRLFDRAAWEEQKKDKNYRNERPPVKTREPEGNFSFSLPMGGSFMQVLVFGVVIVALAFLLYKLFGGTFVKNRKVTQDKAFTIEDIEDRIHESDLERFLREALEKKDYRLAIRVYYLAIIKELSLKDLIRWKRDKTNREYLNEVIAAKPELHGGFRETTLAFERVWYGDIDVREQDYDMISPRFKQFMEAISR